MSTIINSIRRARSDGLKLTKIAAKKVSRKHAQDAKPQRRREGTKIAGMISLLSRKDGATIADLVKATGWQAHSVRGAISGALKKKLGLTVTSETIEDRGRVYKIVSPKEIK